MMETSVDALISQQQETLEVLRERIRQLEEALCPAWQVPIEYGLTPVESKVFSCLVERDFASKPQIMMAIYSDRIDDEPEIKIVDVFICKIRRKLAPHGVTISTVWGQGYRLENRHQYRETAP